MASTAQASSPWRNRFRRLLFLATTATSFYVLLTYLVDRAREARLRALKERRERDLLKNHFTALLSTISFTLYALLPTLQPQVTEAYPVEATSLALQGLSVPTSSEPSVDPTPDASVVLDAPKSGQGDQPAASLHEAAPAQPREQPLASSVASSSDQVHVEGDNRGWVGDSWTSDFARSTSSESEQPSLLGDSLVHNGEDDASTTLSQSISLPPTDTSSAYPSPHSETSALLHNSPPRPPQTSQLADPHKSKKELWKDLKIQTITRSLTTAYIIPLLYLLTSSQLATLARIRYLSEIKANLEESEALDHVTKPQGILGYFSTEAMGLTDYSEPSRISYLNPARYLPAAVTSYLPFPFTSRAGARLNAPAESEDPISVQLCKDQIAAQRAEDERTYLTYSWWLLHEGWRGVASRVQQAVEGVFGSMPLKRDLSVEDWAALIQEVRARIETETVDGRAVQLYSFYPQLLPTYPVGPLRTTDPNPLPTTKPVHRPHLCSLLDQTTAHLMSADATYLIEKGVSSMTRKLVDSLREECYAQDEIGLMLGEPETRITRRLVDCLPLIDRWGKGVWEGIPDSGVENLTSVPEFEGFAALVFGDWAPSE